jgi:hypothetical protein
VTGFLYGLERNAVRAASIVAAVIGSLLILRGVIELLSA